jgi:creatinine amidohydrolase/Fe(II)-dependent formamide hydrolase-like protein
VSDTSQVMALDREKKWIRADRIALANAANGVEGDPAASSAEIGRELLAIKVRNAVAAIRRAVEARD